MRYILVLLGLMFAGVANAIDCEKVPDCESLGYSTESEPNCADNGYMYCPFNHEYKKCVQYDCAKLGFTDSDKSSWCADLIECKGNPQMTLCQKACIATNYDELKYLAETGKCNLITMKKDITIPTNQGFTLAANTTLDGGGHTLQSSGNLKNYKTFVLNSKSGVKNLKIKHQQTEQQQNAKLFYAPEDASDIVFENLSLDVVSTVPNNELFTLFTGIKGIFQGKLDLTLEANLHVSSFLYGNPSFKNANINIKVTKSYNSEVFGHIDSLTFENSNVYIETDFSLFWYIQKVFIQSGSEVVLKSPNTISPQFILAGTAEKPVHLTLDGASLGSVVASNPTDTLTLKGVSYHPTASATTTLTDIPNSPNWTSK